LLEKSKKKTKRTGRSSARRAEDNKSSVRVTIVERKSDFKNLNPGKINKNCKG